MRLTRVRLVVAAAIVLVLGTAATVLASGASDFGLKQEHRLNSQANQLFGGIGKPLGATAAQVSGTQGAASVKLASKLKVTAVLRGNVNGPDTTKLFQNADMIAFWPSDDVPVWGIVCIEGGPTTPGVQRIKLAGVDRGKVETILTGTQSCDGIRRTPWQTILASEEVGPDDGVPGWAIEIYDPLATDGVVFDRTTGVVSGADAANVKPRPALGRFAWEGIGIFPDGTVYAGDELAPINRANGGAIFKFVSSSPPAQPLTAATIAFLSNPANHASSPFAAGTLSALRVGGTSSNYGQGNQRGLGSWIGPITASDARASAESSGATGYYRPEDLEVDPLARANGQVRFCWTDTGVASLQNYGEVLCAEETASGPVVQTFVEGSNLMNQPDNLAFQPGTGILYVIEDSPRVNGVSVAGDIWACLPDGGDVNLQTDGCVRVVSVTTLGSEPTGFIFDESGRTAYLNIQHSPNIASTPVDESRYDEMLVIEGFKPNSGGDDDDDD